MGVLVPATNATAENEYHELAKDFPGLSVHVARVPGEPGPLSRDWEVAFGRDCAQAAVQLQSVHPDVIVVANTSGTFINAEEEIAEQIEDATGTATVTTARAVVSCLKKLGASRIGLVTPYPVEFNEYLTRYLGANEVVSVDVQTNTTADISTIGRYAPSEAYRLARRLRGDFEAIFISCTDFRTIEVLPLLEQDRGVPAISSNLAGFTDALGRVGIGLPKERFQLWRQTTEVRGSAGVVGR